jgi:hypothetical protein
MIKNYKSKSICKMGDADKTVYTDSNMKVMREQK